MRRSDASAVGVGGRIESGVRRAVLDPVAEQALTELRAGGGAVDPCLLEVLADHVHALATSPSLDDLCAAAGCAWAFADLPAAQEGRLDAWGTVFVRRHRDPARVRLVVLHEVAHWVLGRAGVRHEHVDVWLLTLALGAPRATVLRLQQSGRPTSLDLAVETGLPAWAAEARLAEEG